MTGDRVGTAGKSGGGIATAKTGADDDHERNGLVGNLLTGRHSARRSDNQREEDLSRAWAGSATTASVVSKRKAKLSCR